MQICERDCGVSVVSVCGLVYLSCLVSVMLESVTVSQGRVL